MAEISAQAVKALREQTGAGMMDCKKVLADAGGDLKRAVELLRERGLAKAGKREGRATSEGVIAIATEGARGGIVELGCETDFVARTDDFTRLAADLARTVARDAQASSAEALQQAPHRRREGRRPDLGGDREARREHRGQARGPARGAARAAWWAATCTRAASSACWWRSRRTAAGPALQALAKDVAMHVAAADPSPVAVDRGGVPKELLDSERAIFRKQAEQTGKPPAVIEKIVEGRVGKFLSEICPGRAALREGSRPHRRRPAARGGRSARRRGRGRRPSNASRWGGAAKREVGLPQAADQALRRGARRRQGLRHQPDGDLPPGRRAARGPRARHPAVRRDRRRQRDPRRGGGLAGHGPRQRRLHGHDGRHDQRAGAPGRAREGRARRPGC